jgi:hypothetical protein
MDCTEWSKIYICGTADTFHTGLISLVVGDRVSAPLGGSLLEGSLLEMLLVLCIMAFGNADADNCHTVDQEAECFGHCVVWIRLCIHLQVNDQHPHSSHGK